MAFTKMALKSLIEDFNNRGQRPSGRLLTLSRYRIAFNKDELYHICNSCGWSIEIDASGKNELLNDEEVFKALGFVDVDAMDNSPYQWANIIHDLNDTNIPKELELRYDYILDGGTIEHVFNTKSVLENIYKMLKFGGTFIFNQPTFFGLNHGYYNFSPCLWYEYFKANNYKINSFIPYMIKDNIIYTVDNILNNMNDCIPIVEDSINMIIGSVTKNRDTVCNVIPQQGIYSEAWEQNPYEIINKTLINVNDKSLYLYGTGNFVKSMLSLMPIRYRDRITGLISNDSNNIGQSIYGYRVYSIEEILNENSVILIATSNQFHNIIYDRIKYVEQRGVKVIRIFK